MNRVAEVNQVLKSLGIEERLQRGRGYYYFREGDAAAWYSSSVYVFRASDLSVERWLEEWSGLSGKPVPKACAWFARCDRMAVTTEPHPILGDVPVCQRCKDFCSKMKS